MPEDYIRSSAKYYYSKALWEFERTKRINIDNVGTRTVEGKRLRGELLVHLKERAGLKYQEIGELDIFGDLSIIIIRLRTMYKNNRSR